MRVIYDAATGRVLALGDAVEAGEGESVAELTPEESAAQAATAAAVETLGAALREAATEYEAAATDYRLAVDGARERFAAAEVAARRAGKVVGFDPATGAFVAVAAVAVPDPTPDEDAALVASDPKLAALLRVLARQGGTPTGGSGGGAGGSGVGAADAGAAGRQRG